MDSFPSVCSVIFRYIYFSFILSSILVFCLKACLLMRDRDGVDPDGRDGSKKMGGVVGGENVSRMYYVRKKLFSIKAKKNQYSTSRGSCICHR